MRRNSEKETDFVRKLGPVQQKILLLLLAGAALSVTYSPRQYYRLVGHAAREWKEINRRALYRSIRKFEEQGIVDCKERPDGTFAVILTKRGEREIRLRNFVDMKIRVPSRWDGKWRMILFDIPEKKRKFRDIFRSRLQRLGFVELQMSVFVHPYDCEKEMRELVDFFDAGKYVRFVVATSIDDEAVLRDIFFRKKRTPSKKKKDAI